MKLVALLLALLVAVPAFSLAKAEHTIEVRLFVVKKSEILPLFDFQQMKLKGFKIMAEGDSILNAFKNQFNEISSFSVYVPEEDHKNDTVIIRFKNGETRIKKVKRYMAFGNVGKKRIFSDKNIAKLRMNQQKRLVQVDEKDRLRWLKINY